MNAQRGLTLIELMVTLLIMGILAAVAVPSFSRLIATSATTSEANALMSDFALARGQAARTGNPVTICLSTDGATCNASNWTTSGRLIFTDSPTAGTIGTVDLSAGDTILRYNPTLVNSKDVITASSVPNGTYITYSSTGTVVGVVNATPAQFKVCRNTGTFPGSIVTISVTGRASAATTTCP